MNDEINEEDINSFATEKALIGAVEDNNSTSPSQQMSYLEDELALKRVILTLQASELNPDLNKPDLVLGTIKDLKKIKELDRYLQFQIDCTEAGLPESSKFCANVVLSNLNFRRSEDGEQQKLLITRVRSQQVSLNKQRDTFGDKVKGKLFN